MKTESAMMHPRSRRRSPPCRENRAISPTADPRTRVLIRVPMMTAPQVASARTTDGKESASSVSTTASLGPGSMQQPGHAPSSASATFAGQDLAPAVRFDAPHAAIAGPHSAARALPNEQAGWLTMLTRHKALWAASVIVAILLAMLVLRGGKDDASTSRSTPPLDSASSAKKETQEQLRRKSKTKSAAADKTAGEKHAASNNRLKTAARHDSDSSNGGPSIGDPSAQTGSNAAARRANPSDELWSKARAAVNQPARLDDSSRTSSTETSSDDSRSAQNDLFRIVDPPIANVPNAGSHQATQPSARWRDDAPREAARFMGSIERPSYRY